MTTTQFVLQVRGPVETFGEFIAWNPGYMSTGAVADPLDAIRFGSKTSARRFAKRIDMVPVKVVALNV